MYVYFIHRSACFTSSVNVHTSHVEEWKTSLFIIILVLNTFLVLNISIKNKLNNTHQIYSTDLNAEISKSLKI